MAIVTGELYKGFTFGDISSKAYGVYITQEAAYNAPDRDVEVVEIAGRNGAYILDKGRFKNITVSYKCGIALDDEQSFESAIRTFRNALASKAGKYVRLEDDYNVNEFRQAAFLGGIEVDMADRRAGEFTVSFDAMPQRFLKSGETAVSVGGAVTNTQTKSGAVVALESDGGDAVTSLVAQIEPVQSGSGDPSPTNVRPITGWTAANVNVAGKNLAKITEGSTTSNGVTFVKSAQGFVTANGTANPSFGFVNLDYKANTLLIPKGIPLIISGGADNVGVRICWDRGGGTTENSPISYGDDVRYTIPEEARTSWLRVLTPKGGTANATVYPMLRLASDTDDTYEPYKGHTVTVSFGSAGTVYGGTLDVVTGVLTVDRKSRTYGTDSWAPAPSNVATVGSLTRFWLYVESAKIWGDGSVNCDRLKTLTNAVYYDSTTQGIGAGAADSATSIWIKLPASLGGSTTSTIQTWLNNNPIQITYPITPQTYNLTAQQVELLTGDNNVWADTGDITLTYGRDPNKIVNPTLFESHPLLHLWGYGSIGINGDQLSINNDQYGNILLVDKTTHEATSLYTYIYHNSVSPNPKVSLLNEGDTLTLVRGSFISVQLYGRPVVRFTNVSVSVGGGISTSVPSGATQIKNILLTFPEYTFSFGTTKAETIPMTITAAYTYEGAQRTATVTGNIRVVYNVGSNYQSVSIAIPNITNTKPDDFNVSPNADKNGTLQAIYGYSTKRPFAEDADFYFDLDIGEAYKIEDGQTVSVNNAVTIPAQLPTLKSGENTITYADTITQFKIVPRWWEV